MTKRENTEFAKYLLLQIESKSLTINFRFLEVLK